MKRLHRPDLFGWSVFDEKRNIDFHGLLWVRSGGNVLVDPLPMSAHDAAHLQTLGGATHVVVTNSDHTRGPHSVAPSGTPFRGPANAGSARATRSCPACACTRCTAERRPANCCWCSTAAP